MIVESFGVNGTVVTANIDMVTTVNKEYHNISCEKSASHTNWKNCLWPLFLRVSTIWGSCTKNNSDILERLQNKALRIILSTNHPTCTCTQMVSNKIRASYVIPTGEDICVST